MCGSDMKASKHDGAVLANRFAGYWPFGLFLLGSLIFAAGITIEYTGDDFILLHSDPAARIWFYFANPIDGTWFFRPLQGLFSTLIESISGPDPILLHVIHIALHIALATAVFRAAALLKFSRTQAVLASLWMLASQTVVLAVHSNDQYSHLAATLFGFLGVLLAWRYHWSGSGSRRDILLSVFALSIALLSKESAVISFVIIALIVALKKMDERRAGRPGFLRPLLIDLSPFVLTGLAYLLYRSLVIGAFLPSMGEDHNYGVSFGANLPTNVAMLGFALSSPLSSVSVFSVLKSGSLLDMALVVLPALAVVAIIAAGIALMEPRQRRIAFVAAVCALLAMFPMAMMRHVSELYSYSSMPYFSLLAGAAAGALLQRLQGTFGGRYILPALLALLFASHIFAIQSKTSLMLENGRRATAILDFALAQVRTLPPDACLLLRNPPPDRVLYSVFEMSYFGPLQYGEKRVKQLSGRDDIEVLIVDHEGQTHDGKTGAADCKVISYNQSSDKLEVVE